MRLKAHLICPRGRCLVSTLNDLARKEVFFYGMGHRFFFPSYQ